MERSQGLELASGSPTTCVNGLRRCCLVNKWGSGNRDAVIHSEWALPLKAKVRHRRVPGGESGKDNQENPTGSYRPEANARKYGGADLQGEGLSRLCCRPPSPATHEAAGSPCGQDHSLRRRGRSKPWALGVCSGTAWVASLP